MLLIAEFVAEFIAEFVSGHLGPLHPVEQWLTLVLAFGPLVLLAVTVWISRRRHRDATGNPDDGDRFASLGSAQDEREPDRGAAGR